MKVVKFSGFNFGNIEREGDEITSEFKEISTKTQLIDFLINSESFYEVQIFNDFKEFVIISSLKESINTTMNFENRIIDVKLTGEMCYFLHDNGCVSRYNVVEKEYQKQLNLTERFVHMSARYQSLFGITDKNALFQIDPELKLIHEFPKHKKICKMSSGMEHTLLLSSNGDVFSFGGGLRGQLGHGDVNSHDTPKLISAIDGIKITDIACGAFHSCVVSSFGDLYTFGWNACGQLGIVSNKTEGAIKKHQQVFTLPQLIDFEDEADGVKKVYCGHKHTIIQTERNRLFATGLNKFGQLTTGDTFDRDTFVEIPYQIGESEVCCGYWSTYIISNSND